MRDAKTLAAREGKQADARAGSEWESSIGLLEELYFKCFYFLGLQIKQNYNYRKIKKLHFNLFLKIIIIIIN